MVVGAAVVVEDLAVVVGAAVVVVVVVRSPRWASVNAPESTAAVAAPSVVVVVDASVPTRAAPTEASASPARQRAPSEA